MDASIEADGSGLLGSLRRLTDAVVSMDGPMQEAGIEAGSAYLEFVHERFSTNGDGSWEPLAKSTREQRKKRGYGEDAPILSESGELVDSFVPGNANNILRVTPAGIEAGSALDRAAWLHFGNIARNLPARPITVDPDGPTDYAIGKALVSGIAEAAKT